MSMSSVEGLVDSTTLTVVKRSLFLGEISPRQV